MSDPVDPDRVFPREALQSALCEILSAQSSLNMPAEPTEPTTSPETLAYRPPFLAESDATAAHALEHLRAAFALCNRAYGAMESLKTQVYRLAVQLREAGLTPCVRTWLDEE